MDGKINFAILLSLVLILVVSCTEKPFKCHCDTSAVAVNDSIIHAALIDTSAYQHYLRVWKIQPLPFYGAEVYRFKSHTSLVRYNQIYTLVRDGSGAKIIVREYDEKQWIDRYSFLAQEYEIQLTEAQWWKVKGTINSYCYWSNPINTKKDKSLDGGSWLMEGFDVERRNCGNAMYHFDVSQNGDNPNLEKICQAIYRLSHPERLKGFKENRK